MHDLLATAAAGNPRRADLLATVASAQRWLAASTSAWADAAGVPAAALAGPLSSADLDEVVALRTAVFAAVTGSDAGETDQALDAELILRVRLRPCYRHVLCSSR